MMMKLPAGLGIVVMVLLSACGNDKTPLPENVLRLTDGNYKDWQLEKVNYSLLNVTDRVPQCQQDEIYRFYADGKGEIRKGTNPCKPDEPEVLTTGTWEFAEDGEILIVNWKNERWELEVKDLVHNQLVVKGKVFDSYVVTATFEP